MAQSIDVSAAPRGTLFAPVLDAIRKFQAWACSPLSNRDWVALVIVLAGFWFALRPYLFIHDGRLYALQALAGIHPGLAADPVLSHFNQGALSLFTPVYSTLTGWLGLWPAAWTIYGISQLIYYICLVALVAWLLPNRRLAILALTILVSTSGTYPPGIFRFSESFVSARLVAEALVLGSMVAATRHRWWSCALLLIAGTAMHPLMALAGWGLLGWWLCKLWLGRRKALLLAALCLLAAITVALVTLPPMADTWRAIVVARSEFLFMGHWLPSQWSTMISTMAIAGLGLRSHDPRIQSLSEATLLLLFAAVALSLIAEWHSSAFMLSLQPWRVLWLVTIAEIILLVSLLGRPAEDERQLVIQGALLASLTLGTVWSLLILSLIPLALWQRASNLFWHYTALFLFASTAVMVLLSPVVGIAIGQQTLNYISPHPLAPLNLLPKLRGYFFMPIALACIVLMLSKHWTRPYHIALIIVPLFTGAVLLSDHESAHRDANDAVIIQELRHRIAPDEQVYWPSNVSRVWFDLERPSYASLWQGAPGIFSEALARDVNSRLLHLVAAGLEPPSKHFAGHERLIPASPANLNQACSDRRLKWLILPTQAGATLPQGSWQFQYRGAAMGLIDCNDLRPQVTPRRAS